MENEIAAHVRRITDLITAQAHAALGRLELAETEAAERIAAIAPAEYDYEAASRYLSTPRRTLERRVREKRIAYRKDGARVLFTRSALDEYRATLTVARRPIRPLSL